MSNSVSEELKLVNELINKFKIEEALQKVEDVEQNQNLTTEESMRIQVYRGMIHLSFGQPKIALEIAEELYQKSQEVKMPFFSLDALFLKESVMFSLQRFEELYKILEQHEKLLKSIPREGSLKFQEKEALFLIWKGQGVFFRGNIDLTLKYHSKSLDFFEKNDPHSRWIGFNLMGLAWAYEARGELDLALEYNEKVLLLTPKENNFGSVIRVATVYREMGRTFYRKGQLNRAFEYHKLDLEIQKKTKNSIWMNASYVDIIRVLLAQKNIDQAKYYLQELKQLDAKHENEMGMHSYQYAHALILKSSSRTRDHAEAEKIMKRLLKEQSSLFFDISRYIIELCDLYFKEFQLTHEIEILDDIQPLIDRLEKDITISYDSYPLLANLKLLQAKLALLQINMVEARKLLTEAQKIAEEHDLQLLAGEISKEHDRLLKELKLWESIKKEQTSVAERLKLASIDGVMERLQKKRAIEPLESSGQQPVSLLILAAGGVLLFTHPFTDEWKQDNDLFGSFLSAFLTFSDEFFSQGLDRAKFGEDTILLRSVGSFSICYLFRGQTYFAKQKLEKFVEMIQKDPEIWETLEKFEKSSQVAELKDLPKMEGLLNEIFLS